MQSDLAKAESKKFYRSLATIVGPIAGQNLISAAVNAADVVMLGSVGQTAIAASSLAGQVQFILFLIFTGVSSGLIMLTAQYWGKKDTDSIKTLVGIALRLSFSAGIVFGLGAVFFPKALMRIFTNDTNLIAEGAVYLRVVGVSYICLSVSQVYQAAFKSVERVKEVTIITCIALGLNIFLNAVFIYGLFGAPKLGILGVGMATTFSRIVEVAICLGVALKLKEIRFTPAVLFRRNVFLARDFFRYSMPALGNEFVWGAAFAMYSVILGHMGEDIVAANSVVTVVRNLASMLCFGMAYGGAILLGKEMGSGNLELASRNASRLVRSTVMAGLIGSFMVVCMKPLLPYIAQLSETASRYRDILLYINAGTVFGAAVNTVLICGVFRAGGDSKFGFVLDTIIMWGVSVPLGLLAAFVLKLPPVVVYLVLFLDEFEKMPFNVVHYVRRKWLNNITREENSYT